MRLLVLMMMSLGALAHQQPTTMVLLDAAHDHVEMTLHLPLVELELAFGNEVTRDPQQRLAVWGEQLGHYLRQHIRAESESGHRWGVEVTGLSIERVEQKQTGPITEVLATLLLKPNAQVLPRSFVLRYDVILHQVVTHRALVSVRKDWEAGRTGRDLFEVGVIAMNQGSARVEPLAVRFGKGGWWTGFRGMVGLGMDHIAEGADHLLFLLVLLLAAPLLLRGNQWGEFGGSQYSLVRLMQIITAFTIGHSATLLAGSVGWLRLPQQSWSASLGSARLPSLGLPSSKSPTMPSITSSTLSTKRRGLSKTKTSTRSSPICARSSVRRPTSSI